MTFISSQRVWIDEQFIPATLKLEDGKITEIHNGILENSQFYENASGEIDLLYGETAQKAPR